MGNASYGPGPAVQWFLIIAGAVVFFLPCVVSVIRGGRSFLLVLGLTISGIGWPAALFAALLRWPRPQPRVSVQEACCQEAIAWVTASGAAGSYRGTSVS